MPESSQGLRKFWEESAKPRLATTLTVIGLLTAAVIVGLLIRDRWGLFSPPDAAAAWAATDAIADAVTALCTIGIATFALRGLRSLRIARDEIVHRAGREAKLCAIQRMEEVAREIIPMGTAALDALAAENVGVFLGEKDVVQFDPDPTDLAAAKAWRAKVSTKAYNRIVNHLNRLEAWSVYFTTGVADPEVAFGPIGPLLRSWVGQYYAVLLVLRSGVGPSSGKFPNLIQLYLVWSARMDRQQLARLHKDIEGQMQQAQARLEQAQLPDVLPKIGP
jgi:hypothetical protein